MNVEKNSYPQNVEGMFYVTKSCISCGLCVANAPYHFKFAEGAKHAYIYQQPVNSCDIEICFKAVKACPVAAIGYKG